MKTRSGLLLSLSIFAVTAAIPASAQSATDLRQENARLKAELRALQAQGCSSPSSSPATWREDALTATVEAIRVGQRANHPGQPDGHVTLTLTLGNRGNAPIALNYQAGSFRLVDETGHEYRATLGKASGIPTASSSEADPTAVMLAGASRTVTFSAFRVPSSSDALPRRFDVNATFIQIEESASGQVRKVRDYSTGFTNVPASTL